MNLLEQGELPQICSNCLGNAKKSRLVRDSAGAECRLCAQPFVCYHWKLVDPPVPRQTLICRRCSNKLNACQSCVLDLEFHISLKLRDTALRIMREEGGSEGDRTSVLSAIRDAFTKGSNVAARAAEASETITDVIAKFPMPGNPRADGCRTLCVYGIEADLDAGALRSFFNASISKVDYVPKGRYAFFQFTSESDLPQLSAEPVIIDGRRLLLAWGERVAVPSNLQRPVGAVIRAYLRSA